MFLSKISLQNFRNYSKKTFEFDGLTTLVVGPNTSGKTNLLEAIYLLATGRSFRAEVEAEMIHYGEGVARVLVSITDRGRVTLKAPKDIDGTEKTADAKNSVLQSIQCFSVAEEVSEDKTELEILLTTGSVSGKKVAKKKYLVNGVSKRMVDFIGRLKAVYFGPEDLQLVTDSPSLRRKYLDMVLSQVDREYRRASLSYEKGLRQRNRILEEIQRYKDTKIQREEIKRRLYFWDQLLVKNGNYITEKREEFVEFLNSLTKLLNSNLVGEGKDGQEGGKGGFGLEYLKSVISPAALGENFQREVILGQTLVGPHRDDIKFKLKIKNKQSLISLRSNKQSLISGENEKSKMIDRDLSIYGSRGEQRLAVLWLKIGELEFVSQKTGDPSASSGQDRPVLLLDDIFSELDKENIRLIGQVGLIGRQQTIITTTEEDVISEKVREKMEVIRL